MANTNVNITLMLRSSRFTRFEEIPKLLILEGADVLTTNSQLLAKKQIFCSERTSGIRRQNNQSDQVKDDQRHSPQTVSCGEYED